jgi:ribosomal protein S18 acetylase RimI-like enzyme
VGYYRMRRDLGLPVAAVPMPPGVIIEEFNAGQASACRDLMNRAYGEVGNEPVPVGAWYNAMVGDSEYDPALIWVAKASDAIVGFCQCWRLPFIKDLVVDRGWRRRGVGAAMLTHALTAFVGRRATSIDLKTDIGNVKAQSLYRQLGFVVVAENA